jgi:hypothetical protein
MSGVWGKMRERFHWERLGVDGRIILKWFFFEEIRWAVDE